MIRVGIVGATGYAGAELVRILSVHPQVKLTVLTSRQYAGVPFGDVYPALHGPVGLVCRELDPDLLAAAADLFFLALPHKLPMEIAPTLLAHGRRVVDLSADFRFRRVKTYESYYQPHTAPELLTEAVYGLCEAYRDRIATARLIGNPGCYPTSILLPLLPLVREKLIDPGSVVADSKSGVSGAGRSPSLGTHFCEVNESFKAYKVAVHRHCPEIEEVLERAAGRPVPVTFVPHLVPMTRGMLSTIYARPEEGVDESNVFDCLRQAYRGEPFVRLCPAGGTPDTRNVRGTNVCQIGIHFDRSRRRLILISAIDNLVKGAAGQAVQNMNIMSGFEETAGLTPAPFPV